MASKGPVSAQETGHVKIEEVYEKMLLVAVVNGKPDVGSRADPENLTHDLEGVIYMFENVPGPTH